MTRKQIKDMISDSVYNIYNSNDNELTNDELVEVLEEIKKEYQD